METYEWQKNKAVVDRLYYSERILTGSTILAVGATATNMLFIQKNYFASTVRPRIPKIWTYWGIGNAVCLFVLLRPLTKEEISTQWRKRVLMGKWLYSLYHLEPTETGSKPSHWRISSQTNISDYDYLNVQSYPYILVNLSIISILSLIIS